MESETLINSVAAVAALLFLAAVLAFVLKRLRFPYTVGLVLLGAALAMFADEIPGIGEAIGAFDLAPELIIFVFIPTLIFESSLNIDVRKLIRNLVPTLALAILGLLLSALIVGYGLSLLTPIGFGAALVFGVLISATDPVAVIALFKEVGAPQRLTVLMEGESLFNDATAIVTTQILLAVLVTGIMDRQMVFDGVVRFLVVFLGGLVVGLGFGYLLTLAIRLIGDEPGVQIALTLVIAYGSFIVAEHFLHTSGIMAVLGSGLILGYQGPLLYTDRVREHLEVFWEHLAFIANSFIFLLLGLAEVVFLGNIAASPGRLLIPVVVAVVLVTVSRLLVVFGLTGALSRLGARPVSVEYRTVMWWGGLRGAVAVAIALALPSTLPFRWQIIDLTFSVVLFTLFVNGTTMRWLLRKLGLDRPSPVTQMVGAFAESRALRAALARLEESRSDGIAGPAATQHVRTQLAGDLAEAERHLRDIRGEIAKLPDGTRMLLWLRALALQQQVYRERYADGMLDLRGVRELEWDIHDREDQILRGQDVVEAVLPARMRVDNWLGVAQFAQIVPESMRARSATRIHRQVSAIFAAARAVLDDVEHCGEMSAATPQEIDELAAYYEDVIQQAARLMSLAEERVDGLGQALQERQLYTTARHAKLASLGSVSIDGDRLPNRLVEHLESNGSASGRTVEVG